VQKFGFYNKNTLLLLLQESKSLNFKYKVSQKWRLFKSSKIQDFQFIFQGSVAPIDLSDAGGMNLLDIRTRDWSQQCLDVSLT
jgi:hypothetical protein